MYANRHESLLQRDVHAVVGCVIEVLNVRGHGLSEGQLIFVILDLIRVYSQPARRGGSIRG
jgi:hypothetical protein